MPENEIEYPAASSPSQGLPLKMTMKRTKQNRLSTSEEKELRASIRGFLSWLRTKLEPSGAEKYDRVRILAPTRADWIMWVKDASKREVLFNPYILAKCSFSYFRMIVLHECFHLFVQDLPNKEDAKRLKDDFGDSMMKLLDIEADYFTAMYYKEKKKASLSDIFSLYHEGSRVFGDPQIRVVKLERFIGSVLSIAKAYFENSSAENLDDRDLYLPTISNLPTEESLHVLIAKKSHFMLGQIHATYQDFFDIRQCYTNGKEYTAKGYVERLVRFASKALRIEVPERIEKQLRAMDA